MSETEQYYKTLLLDAERLIQEAHDMLSDRDATILTLLALLKTAAEDLDRLEDIVLGEKDKSIEH